MKNRDETEAIEHRYKLKTRQLEMTEVNRCIQRNFPKAQSFKLLPGKRKKILIYKLNSECGLILVCSRGKVTRKNHIGFFRMLVHKHLKKTVDLKKYLWINLIDMEEREDTKNLSQNGKIVRKMSFFNEFYNCYLEGIHNDFRIYFDSIIFENRKNPYDDLISIAQYFVTSGEYNDETVAPKFPRKDISTYGSRTRQGFSKKEEKEYAPLLDFLRTNNLVKIEHVEIREDNFTYCNFDLLASINGHSYLIELETEKRTIGSIGALSILEFGCNHFHDENKSKIEGVLIISNSRLLKDIKNIESEFSRYTRNKIKIISRDDCIERMTRKDIYDD